MSRNAHRFMLSGGGTGGHIFPALSIADELRRRLPDARLLFVGAVGRMEMTRVPAAGYPIVGLPIEGFDRTRLFKNLLLPFKLLYSILKCFVMLMRFRPHAVIGTGGFASAPLILASGLVGIPVFVQEQNSYAGITNRIAGRFAKKVFVAYEGMEKHFSPSKIRLTGNPIRPEISKEAVRNPDIAKRFNIDVQKPTLLAVGGSLGAKIINQTIDTLVPELTNRANLIWICGKAYYPTYALKYPTMIMGFYLSAFEEDLYVVYPWADVVVSRAGAGTLSELAAAGKACILIPSPNVAENHQVKNALAFSEKGAARVVTEDRIQELSSAVFHLLESPEERQHLSENILKLARPDATSQIVTEILNTLMP
ncbi:MAG: undecaprenyldiphospho-muramoylpentapeptide beta-N-acetylglucosaminyltransferase [Thermaurantimonas sp.]